AERTGIIDGLFTQTLPEYPYPLKMVLYSQTPSGVKSPLITVEHPGGEFSVPYSVPEGTLLILEVLNRVVARVEARL
ncbi:MAG: penicillin-binding protein, partial [Spirochaetes bacterium]|nr:penicillin-binding protein [Spirochaetota bacterium]